MDAEFSLIKMHKFHRLNLTKMTGKFKYNRKQYA
jgi:hypothetical protein